MKQAIAKEILTLVCDDIREEIGGKASLMGVYNDIVLGSLPVVLPKLSFAFILRGIIRKFSKVDVFVTLPNEKPVKVNTIDLPNIDDFIKIGETCNLYMAMVPFHIKNTGQVKLELFFDGAEQPQVVHTFEVKVAPLPKTAHVKHS